MTQLFCLPTKESYFFVCEISTALVTHFLLIQLTHTELMIFLLFIWFWFCQLETKGIIPIIVFLK